MKRVTVVFVAVDQPHFTQYALEALLENTPEQLADIVVVLNEAEEKVVELVKDYEGSRLSIVELESRKNYGQVLNIVLETIENDFVSLVHNDTIVTGDWLKKLLSVFDDYSERYGEEVTLKGSLDLVELAGVSPYQSYNEHRFFVYRETDRLFCKMKPPNKSTIQRSTLEEILKERYLKGLEGFARQVQEESDSWYSFVPEITSSCVLINLNAFKRVCKYFDERFLGAGGEIRFACRQLQRVGYVFARADTCFVHHHGNLTNDGADSNYGKLLEFNNQLLAKTEVE